MWASFDWNYLPQSSDSDYRTHCAISVQVDLESGKDGFRPCSLPLPAQFVCTSLPLGIINRISEALPVPIAVLTG